jgi:polyhydroxyalkanoate synthesis regulator phasin
MTEQHDSIKKLRDLVDETADKIVSGDLSLEEAEELVKETRQKAEMLIADDMDKYDLIYESRFRRLIDQFIKRNEVAG